MRLLELKCLIMPRHNFKLRKVDLQRQGYDPVACDEPIYVRNDKLACYQEYSKSVLQLAGFPPFITAKEK
jgi:fatty-acyl-CoA synthase